MTQPATTGTTPVTGYTQDEINAVVQQLVLSSITTPIDTLGVRRSDLAFNQFQQTAAGLFVLYPNAPYYVLWLGVQRIRDQVTAEAAILVQLQAAITATGMKTTPVTDVSPLFAAQSALQNLAAAAANRTSSIGSVSTAPAYQQFSQSVSSFLGGPGQNVKSNGQIVMTPQQAKAAIPGLLKQLQVAHEAVVASIELVVGGIDNYNSVSLPAIVSTSVLQSAAALIGNSANTLSGLTPAQRLTEVRQVVLNLIAAKTAVDTFGTINQASDFYTLTGVGMPYSDAQHLATPAVAVGDVTGAMGIITGATDFLLLVLDDETTVPLTLPPSIMAELDGQSSGMTAGGLSGFIVSDGTLPNASVPQNNIFELVVAGTTHTSTLTASASSVSPPYAVLRTADEVASDINSTASPALPAGVEAQGYFSPLKYNGKLTAATALGTTTWTVPSYGSPPLYISNLFSLNVQVGDLVEYAGSYFPITAVDPLGTYVQTTAGSPPTGSVLVQLGPASRKVKVICTDPATQLAARTNIQVTAGATTSSNYAAATACLQTLGFVAGMNTSCAPTTPDVVAAYINANTALVDAGTYVSTLYAGSGRGSTTNAQVLTLTEAETLGSQSFATTTITYMVTALVVQGVISVGDTLALRSGPNPGAYYTITEINGDTGAIGHPLALGDTVIGTGTVAGAAASNVDVEFGPTLAVDPYDVVTVVGPNANQGVYTVASQGITPLDVNLVSSLTSSANGSVPSVFNVTYGKRSLTLASLDTTTSSEVYVAGNAAGLFFSVATQEATATASATSFLSTTLTFTVGAGPTGAVSVGDSLNTTNTSSGASACYVIQTINGSSTLEDHTLALGDIIVAVGSIGGPVSAAAFFTRPFTQRGTTPWFQLPSIPNGLSSGDLMEVYPTQYNSPSIVYSIEQVITGINVIELSPDITDGTTWTFTPQPVPFARLRVGIVNDYSAIQALMQSWLNNEVNQPLYFINMNGLINPLLTSDNPTVAQVGTATNAVNTLWGFLQGVKATALSQPPAQAIDTILAEYTVEPVSVVDTMITSYSNQGSDRAVDILLSGDFATFFGLTMNGASYSGAMQEAARAVAMNDLPVSKVNRPEQQNGVIQSTSVTGDPEYPSVLAAETVGGAQPEIPGSYGRPTNYGSK